MTDRHSSRSQHGRAEDTERVRTNRTSRLITGLRTGQPATWFKPTRARYLSTPTRQCTRRPTAGPCDATLRSTMQPFRLASGIPDVRNPQLASCSCSTHVALGAVVGAATGHRRTRRRVLTEPRSGVWPPVATGDLVSAWRPLEDLRRDALLVASRHSTSCTPAPDDQLRRPELTVLRRGIDIGHPQRRPPRGGISPYTPGHILEELASTEHPLELHVCSHARTLMTSPEGPPSCLPTGSPTGRQRSDPDRTGRNR